MSTEVSQPAYPRGFVTPSGRAVTVRKMANALRVIRQDPEAMIEGWDWAQTPGYCILHDFSRGLHDRINRRAVTR